MAPFNRIAARKDIGAINYRLLEHDLNPGLRRQIIARHLDNLLDTLPEQFHGLLLKCRHWNYESQLDLAAGIDELKAQLPVTYGSITAGTQFGFHDTVFTKRKGGCEYLGDLGPHLPADAIVLLVD